MVDVIGNSCDFSDGDWVKAQNFIRKNRDILFDSECVDAFLDVFSEENFVKIMPENPSEKVKIKT